MLTCSYCGRENDETRAECLECGTELRSSSEASPGSGVSSRRLRTALAAIGIGGGLLWLIFSFLVLLFHGFKAGGAQGGMSRGEWALCLAAILITFVYYAVVSNSVWSRRLLFAGIAVHVLWAAAAFSIVTLSDGGVIFTPLLLAGVACWIAYATVTPLR